LDKAVIYEKLKELMISEFKIEADSIGPEKLLNDDLQLDSLDMVDLILSLSDYIGEKVDPSLFKDAHIVQDLVDSVTPLWKSE
jgi:acyl carrier protein